MIVKSDVVSSCPIFTGVQGWSLGCVKCTPAALGGQDAVITQPRDHSLADRCTFPCDLSILYSQHKQTVCVCLCTLCNNKRPLQIREPEDTVWPRRTCLHKEKRFAPHPLQNELLSSRPLGPSKTGQTMSRAATSKATFRADNKAHHWLLKLFIGLVCNFFSYKLNQ